MSETREFPTEVVASLSSGVLLCDFSAMHECAEFLMGHPIWTHHFANKDLWLAMQRSILAQCPGMPTEMEGVNKDNYGERVAELVGKLGASQRIQKGDGSTAKSPLDGIPDRLKDRTAIIISIGTGTEGREMKYKMKYNWPSSRLDGVAVALGASLFLLGAALIHTGLALMVAGAGLIFMAVADPGTPGNGLWGAGRSLARTEPRNGARWCRNMQPLSKACDRR